jgi:hypothetical protein
MTVSEAFGFTVPNDGDQAVEGSYFAWSADTGDAYEQGVLGGPWTKTFDSIATLPEIRCAHEALRRRSSAAATSSPAAGPSSGAPPCRLSGSGAITGLQVEYVAAV